MNKFERFAKAWLEGQDEFPMTAGNIERLGTALEKNNIVIEEIKADASEAEHYAILDKINKIADSVCKINKDIKVNYTLNAADVFIDGDYIKTLDLSIAALTQWTDECVNQGGTEDETVNEWIYYEICDGYDGYNLNEQEKESLSDQLRAECSGSLERAFAISQANREEKEND